MADNSLSLLKQAFTETGTQLDRIIVAYKREKPSHPETIVEYENGSISSFNTEGELGENSIPDKKNTIKVDIGTAVTSIGYAAFSYCSGLTSITIPDGVTSIGQSAFSGCSGLTSLVIPDSVKSIGAEAFYICRGLTSLVIPDSVTSIGDNAFRYTDNMETITLENKTKSQVQSLQNYPWGAIFIGEGVVAGTITFICSDGNIVLNKRISGGDN